jgi:hypothetical protein
MRTMGHCEQEDLHFLREADSSETTVEVCPKHGISQPVEETGFTPPIFFRLVLDKILTVSLD